MPEAKASERGTKGSESSSGTNRLTEEFESYLEARLQKVLTGVSHRIGDAAGKLGDAHIGPGLVRGAGRKLAEHAPGKAALASAAVRAVDTASHAKDTAAHAKDAIADKVKDVTGASHEPRSSASNAGHKSMTVIEDIDIGVPVREAYNQWTQFQEFGSFAKGVVSVEQEDETTTQWQVKVGKSTRAYKGTITEQIPDERIAWTSEGAKGTTRGVVTFHPLGENLTKVLLVMEYFPKGIVEKTGNLVRAQGRRARLDLKAFRKFVMMQGEATGGWRGEIRDAEVVSDTDEDEETPEEAYEDEDEEEEAEDEDEEGDAEPEYEDEVPEDEEEEDEEEEDEEDEDEEDEEDEDEEEEEEPEDEYEEDDEGEEEEEADEAGAEETDERPRSRRSRKS